MLLQLWEYYTILALLTRFRSLTQIYYIKIMVDLQHFFMLLFLGVSKSKMATTPGGIYILKHDICSNILWFQETEVNNC